MKRAVHVSIFGQVQGVFYRGSSCKKAVTLSLTGFVRNCPDGSVELWAEGDDTRLQELIQWCRQGPPGAQVSDIKIEWAESTGRYPNFSVKHS